MALIRLFFVDFPGRLALAIARQRPECADGFAALQPPSSAGDLQAILHEVTASACDHAWGDGIPRGQGVGIVQMYPFTG